VIKKPKRKSLIVALSEAETRSEFAAVRTMPERARNFTKRMALDGRQVDGAIELAYLRGFQAGYEQCLRDGKRRKAAFALQPGRAESMKGSA
jgi:hypothetical protein